MRFIIDIDVVALEELSGANIAPETMLGHIEDALDNAGLETNYTIKYDDQVPEADFND